MNFLEAVKAMKEGKKVRRVSWSFSDSYLRALGGNVITKNNEVYPLDTDDFLATDWEIVEEKKTLWDKIRHCSTCGHDLRACDVKQALKEFLTRYSEERGYGSPDGTKAKELAKEIFGSRMVD